MSEDLKLGTSQTTNLDYEAQIQPPSGTGKKSGCGCFLVGCVILLALIILPIVGGGIWVASMDDAEWGSKIVIILKNPDFSGGFKEGIQESDKITAEQKIALTAIYDKFLTDYDKLPPQKQEMINKNIFRVIKKLITDPESFDKETPKELMEIITALNLGSDVLQLKTTIPTQNTPPTTTSTDPYSFDIDTTTPTKTTPPPTTTTPPTTTQPKHTTEYDF